MVDEIDLSQSPDSPHGDDAWFSLTIPDKVGTLTRLHGAICKWQGIADQELQVLRREVEQRRTSAWDEHGYDPVQEEASLFLETERAMFANLGVTIASVAENFIIGICKRRNVLLTDSDGESNFGIICRNLNASLGTIVDRLPGYAGNQRARLLGNCFKHNDGTADSRFEKKYTVKAGTPIEYETECWKQMIEGTRTLLEELCKLL